MSGITGIWNLDGRPVEEGVLTGMSATLAHRGPDGEGVWVQGPVGLACQLLRVTPEAATETQPLVHASGAVLVFDGRLDNREELLAGLKAAPGLAPESPDPALVLAAYEAFGERFPERLNGDFALGLVDPHRRQLLLARDAIGVRPLYYARTRDTFLFASEIKALLAHPQVSPRPNDDQLATFLIGNQAPDNQGLTFFEGVSSLPPAHMALLTPQGFVTRRYWDFDPTRRVRLSSFQEYAEAFRHHFEQAVRRRLRSAYPVAVSVSGGLDSSSIFCLAETLRRGAPGRHPPLLGISYTSTDGSPSDETTFLLEIERAYGVVIERVPMRVGFLDTSRETVWHVEVPFLDVVWNAEHPLLDTVRQRGARLLLTGLWNDQMLFDQAYLVDLFRRLAWGQAWTHLREFGQWFPDADSRDFRRRFLHDAAKYYVPAALVPWLRRLRPKRIRAKRDHPWYTNGFQKRVRQYPSQQTLTRSRLASSHAKSLYQRTRSAYLLFSIELNNKLASMHGLETAFPFLDRDLLCFLMGIPGEIATWKGIPRAIQREAMRGVLPAVIQERHWRAESFDLLTVVMEGEYLRMVQWLQSDGMAVRFGYANRKVIREELSRLKSRLPGLAAHEVTEKLIGLLGLEIWLRVFFDREMASSQEGIEYGGAVCGQR